jgi:tRNA1Val (adenine37-N6)-methyltransferase
MPNPFFHFKHFTVYHDRSGMKVTTDGCLFGAWCAREMQEEKPALKHILDIGTGTGLLSLMIAQKNKVEIDAVEIDASSSQQAAENIAASPWKNNIRVYHYDILDFSFDTVYDAIASNPPFYERELESENVQKNLAHHGHGLKMKPLLHFIKKQLKEDGHFYLLLPYKRLKDLERIINASGLFM